VALSAGGALALGFSPLLALLGAAATACLLATGVGLRRTVAAWSFLVAVWLVGDGMRAVASARTLADGAGSLLPASPMWLNGATIALWALGGFALGYALPAWAGGFAGRRVTWGTGWLTAGAVSVGLSLALAGILGGWG
jgi:hypothetical protein